MSGNAVLITGGLGFIGSALARQLACAGTRVRILDNLHPGGGGQRFHDEAVAGAETIVADVTDAEAVGAAVADVATVYHLAGLSSHADSMRDPLGDLRANVAGTITVLEACRSRNPSARVVFASTRQVYGRVARLPVDESHPVAPLDVNGIDKLAAESFVELYARIHGIQGAVLRLTNTYGPGMRIRDARQMFLGIWIRQCLEGSPIQVFGDGLQRRDFTFVDDAVAALIAAARPEATGVYNLGGEDAVPLADLARLLIRIAGGGTATLVPFPSERKAIDIGDYQGDYGRIRTHLGWSPRIGLKQGLELTLDYYRKHHDRYR